MSAYEPSRRPDGREPLRGALPDEVELHEDAVEGHVLVHGDLIDESGGNPTHRKLDEDISDEEE